MAIDISTSGFTQYRTTIGNLLNTTGSLLNTTVSTTQITNTNNFVSGSGAYISEANTFVNGGNGTYPNEYGIAAYLFTTVANYTTTTLSSFNAAIVSTLTPPVVVPPVVVPPVVASSDVLQSLLDDSNTLSPIGISSSQLSYSQTDATKNTIFLADAKVIGATYSLSAASTANNTNMLYIINNSGAQSLSLPITSGVDEVLVSNLDSANTVTISNGIAAEQFESVYAHNSNGAVTFNALGYWPEEVGADAVSNQQGSNVAVKFTVKDAQLQTSTPLVLNLVDNGALAYGSNAAGALSVSINGAVINKFSNATIDALGTNYVAGLPNGAGSGLNNADMDLVLTGSGTFIATSPLEPTLASFNASAFNGYSDVTLATPTGVSDVTVVGSSKGIVRLSAGSLANFEKIDVAAGQLNIVDSTQLVAANAGKIVNVGTLNLDNAAAGTYDLSFLGMPVNATHMNFASGSQASAGSSVTLKNAPGAATVTPTFNYTGNSGQAITYFAGTLFNALNIAIDDMAGYYNKGDALTVAGLTANNAVTLSVNTGGSQAHTITTLASSAATAVNVNGTVPLTIGSLTVGLATIDASGLTATNSANAGLTVGALTGGATFTGSAYNDVITISDDAKYTLQDSAGSDVYNVVTATAAAGNYKKFVVSDLPMLSMADSITAADVPLTVAGAVGFTEGKDQFVLSGAMETALGLTSANFGTQVVVAIAATPLATLDLATAKPIYVFPGLTTPATLNFAEVNTVATLNTAVAALTGKAVNQTNMFVLQDAQTPPNFAMYFCKVSDLTSTTAYTDNDCFIEAMGISSAAFTSADFVLGA